MAELAQLEVSRGWRIELWMGDTSIPPSLSLEMYLSKASLSKELHELEIFQSVLLHHGLGRHWHTTI